MLGTGTMPTSPAVRKFRLFIVLVPRLFYTVNSLLWAWLLGEEVEHMFPSLSLHRPKSKGAAGFQTCSVGCDPCVYVSPRPSLVEVAGIKPCPRSDLISQKCPQNGS